MGSLDRSFHTFSAMECGSGISRASFLLNCFHDNPKVVASKARQGLAFAPEDNYYIEMEFPGLK